MTIRKQYPARSYETFGNDQDTTVQSPTSYQYSGDADKSRSAAAEARRLASQGSWAENFGSPATQRTPAASTVDDDESRDVRYPQLLQDDPSDPPPVYTPSVSTQVASQSPAAPSSPVATRPMPVGGQEPVSAPSTSSPLSNPPAQSSPRTDEEEGSSTLPEVVPQQPEEEEEDSDTLPVFMRRHRHGHGRMWCRGRRKDRSCGGHRHGWRHHDKRRARKIKKTIFFLLMLIACLSLLIPGLCNSFKNVETPFFPPSS
jgi:hypothetical protein